jgi:5,6-dimethylbenzimidazole synthase
VTDFTDADRAAVYRVIAERRDVRQQFTPRPVPRDLLLKVLGAAHLAPIVGFSQPWDFVVIEDIETLRQVKADFNRQNAIAAELYDDSRSALYRGLKLEGILEAPLNVCVTCDRSRGGPHVLGRNTAIDGDLFSVCLAVQDLWLAARAEGLGVGWVSILDHSALGGLLGLLAGVVPVAYLCVGYVSWFEPVPDLEAAGWASRDNLTSRIHTDRWGGVCGVGTTPRTDGDGPADE